MRVQTLLGNYHANHWSKQKPTRQVESSGKRKLILHDEEIAARFDLIEDRQDRQSLPSKRVVFRRELAFCESASLSKWKPILTARFRMRRQLARLESRPPVFPEPIPSLCRER